MIMEVGKKNNSEREKERERERERERDQDAGFGATLSETGGSTPKGSASQ
jgi:hypothetical protein